MEETHEIKQLLVEVNSRKPALKNYQQMSIEELSGELQGALKFEQDTIKKIDNLQKNGLAPDLIKYAKIICGNITQREISAIQEAYLNKVDAYLK